MNDMIRDETTITIVSLLWGIRVCAIYEILLYMRCLVSHAKVLIYVTDFLYAVLAGFCTFCMIFSYNDGVVRWYIFGSVLIGIVVFHKVLGKNILKLSLKALQMLLKSVKMKADLGFWYHKKN